MADVKKKWYQAMDDVTLATIDKWYSELSKSKISEDDSNRAFDEQAKRLNLKYHEPRPEVWNKSVDMGMNKTQMPFQRTPVIPLNAAIRDIYDMVTNFDVARMPDYDNMPTAFCGHIIFTRPSLYINVNSGVNHGYTDITSSNDATNYFIMQTEPLTGGFASDGIGKILLHPLTHKCDNPYMPLFYDKALTYSTNDVGIKTIDKGQTYYGHNIKYGHYSEDHKAGGTLSIEFLNDRYWSIMKTCYMWMAYIYMVSKTNAIRPSMASQMNGVLDYAGSIYYLVTDMDKQRLVYWEKLTGVFPKTIPFSLFSTEDNPKTEDKVSIEFDFGIKSDPCDPNVLEDINILTFGSTAAASSYLNSSHRNKFGGSVYTRHDSFNGGITARSNVEAARPAIHSVIDGGTMQRHYYLDWIITAPSKVNEQ